MIGQLQGNGIVLLCLAIGQIVQEDSGGIVAAFFEPVGLIQDHIPGEFRIKFKKVPADACDHSHHKENS